MAFSRIVCITCLALAGAATGVHAQLEKVGAGAYSLAPKAADHAVPAAPYRTEAMRQRAAPSNQWYSALVYSAKPEVLFAHPLTILPSTAGIEFALPSKTVVPTERRDVEIHYPHQDGLLLSPLGQALERPVLAQASDWAIDIAWGAKTPAMTATVAHGSPFVSLRIAQGDVRLQVPPGATRSAASDARVLALDFKGKAYALFGPTGVQWEQRSGTEWIGHLPAGKGYVAAAALPDASAATQALFLRHAYAFLTDTRVDWAFDEARSILTSTYVATAQTMEGPAATPLLGLLPHQWYNNPSLQGKLGASYASLRGAIKLITEGRFQTQRTYNGFVPYWPGLDEQPRSAELRDLLKTDQRNARRMMLEIGIGPYWQGKGLQRITKLMDVTEQQGDLAARDQLLQLLKGRVEQWFSGDNGKTYFHYDKAQGTVVSYPEEYFGVEQMNDHHFHYGYWIRAMADIALRDPQWAAKERWGGMVEWLIADIATTERGAAAFPFIRNFDHYEGHSWASGIGLGPFGNNQESSSEAINAWAGLILWAEITGNKALRDVGIYLYTNEIEAINTYWFDLHGLVFPPEYQNVETSMVFGGKYAHNTWWIDEPRQIKGINLLPITSASTYLGRDPAFVKRSMATLKPDTEIYAARGKVAKPIDIWQDLFAKTLALADPQAGLAQWDRWGSFELGDTRSHTLHWLLSLQAMGTPDFETTANTTLYSVFKRPDGKKTYLAFNASKQPITVRFSDGVVLQVAPGRLARQ